MISLVKGRDHGVVNATAEPRRTHLRIVTDKDDPRPDLWRPDCIDGPRPCVKCRCRHHNLLEVSEHGVLEVNAKRLKPGRKRAVDIPPESQWWVERWTDLAVELLFEMEETCSLDVALRGGQTFEAIGKILGVTKQSARKICLSGLRKLADASGHDLGTLINQTIENE